MNDKRVKTIFHIGDIHIRNVQRHKEYRIIFEKMFDEIRKRGTDDAMIYLAGDIVHAKLEMSPELVREVTWLFTECSNLCPTILIAGNHDCNMNNTDRLDVLTPIVEALNLPNFYYLRDTQIWNYGDIDFAVFSIFSNRNDWPKAEQLTAKKRVALFHGPIDNSLTSVGYAVSSRHFTTSIFDGYDVAMCGDIHLRQELISPLGCKIVYPSSLIQQNFGEPVHGHGFLVWDMDTLTYEEVDISNDYGYYTLDVDAGVVPDVTDIPKYARLRVRFSNTDTADIKRAVTKIKLKYKINDFAVIRKDTLSNIKTGDRSNRLEFENIGDVNYQNQLIGDYINRMLPFIEDAELVEISEINKQINDKIEHDDVYRNIVWKPLRFEFSNMFSYGEDNAIDFSKIGGLVGMFAPNASGKCVDPSTKIDIEFDADAIISKLGFLPDELK